MTCGTRRCGEEGSATVEFAMAAVLLFTVLFGVLAIGLALYSYNVISEAAREGTRYAIVRGSGSCAYLTPGCNVSAAAIQTYIQNLGFPGINSNNISVATAWSPTTAGATCSPSAACNNPGNQVKVTVTYSFPLIIPFVPSQTLEMSSTSQMVISQ